MVIDRFYWGAIQKKRRLTPAKGGRVGAEGIRKKTKVVQKKGKNVEGGEVVGWWGGERRGQRPTSRIQTQKRGGKREYCPGVFYF